MEKPERLLYIYTRLLNGKTLSKDILAQQLNVNARSIQRDISDINNFIYEDHEWRGLDGKVIYDTSIERHRLKIDRYKFKNNRLLNLIFRMKNFTPMIHEDTYNLIRGLNANSNLAEKLLSNKLLSQFKVHKELNESSLIYKIQLAIENSNEILIKYENHADANVIPLYTRYFTNKYWFTYLQKNKILTLDLSSISDIEQLTTVFDRTVFNEIQYVVMLVTEQFWSEIKRQFIILDTQKTKTGYKVKMIISKQETMQLAYEYPVDITLLYPEKYVESFKHKIKSLFDKYNV